jgi:uncharacterized lipoprotein
MELLHRWHLLSFMTLMLLLLSGCIGVGKDIPRPSNNFVPKVTYGVDYDTAWTKLVTVLGNNGIPIASSSKENGQISTGYVEGPQTIFGPFIAVTASRYKYNVFLSKAAPRQTTVSISPIVEASTTGKSSTPFNDVSSQNTQLVSNLKNWLYEKFEQSL